MTGTFTYEIFLKDYSKININLLIMSFRFTEKIFFMKNRYIQMIFEFLSGTVSFLRTWI